jgi:hypothetical protein
MSQSQICQPEKSITNTWIKRYRNSPEHYPYQGACCIFVPQDKYFGLKLHDNLDIAKNAYKLQNIAANFKLAPPTIGKIETFNSYIDKYHIYGYLTRIAITTSKFSCDIIYKFWCDFYCKTGYFLDDMHNGNMGMYNGNIVCIDYSHYNIGAFLRMGYVQRNGNIYPLRCFSTPYLRNKFKNYDVEYGNLTVNKDKCIAEIWHQN